MGGLLGAGVAVGERRAGVGRGRTDDQGGEEREHRVAQRLGGDGSVGRRGRLEHLGGVAGRPSHGGGLGLELVQLGGQGHVVGVHGQALVDLVDPVLDSADGVLALGLLAVLDEGGEGLGVGVGHFRRDLGVAGGGVEVEQLHVGAGRHGDGGGQLGILGVGLEGGGGGVGHRAGARQRGVEVGLLEQLVRRYELVGRGPARHDLDHGRGLVLGGLHRRQPEHHHRGHGGREQQPPAVAPDDPERVGRFHVGCGLDLPGVSPGATCAYRPDRSTLYGCG